MTKSVGRVVVVDDEATTLEMTVDLLQDVVEEVRSTTDSREVWQMLHDWSADVLITDLQMPDINGTELIETVRASHPDLGIIVISSFATQASRDALQKYLVDAILDKPDGFKELPEVVQNLVARQREHRSRNELGEKAKVLVADDHETVRDLVRDVWESRTMGLRCKYQPSRGPRQVSGGQTAALRHRRGAAGARPSDRRRAQRLHPQCLVGLPALGSSQERIVTGPMGSGRLGSVHPQST